MGGMVFGIGLSKTGTNSLNEALCSLGYRSIHYPDCALMLSGQYAEALRGYDAATDISVAAFYRELDAAFPGSKFILTVRQLGSWLRSVGEHMSRRPPESLEPGEPRGDIRARLYGTRGWDADLFVEAYRRHVAAVRAHFADRPVDLLQIDVCAGQGWEKLCPFLGRPTPAIAFPSLNRSEERRMSA
ncbi:MAG: hypothetical protein KIS87_10595 [Phycisphaeraceae bacterium]|nr:hypothetical protein [Phycisphaeraceae bacterium]